MFGKLKDRLSKCESDERWLTEVYTRQNDKIDHLEQQVEILDAKLKALTSHLGKVIVSGGLRVIDKQDGLKGTEDLK